MANGTIVAILSSPITLTVPATKTAEDKNYIISGAFGPIGRTVIGDGVLSSVLVAIVVSTSSSPTTTSSFTQDVFRLHTGDELALGMITLQEGLTLSLIHISEPTRPY